MIKTFDFKEIYILYKFIKILVEAILRNIKLKLNNILSRIIKNPDKIDSLFIRLINLYYFLSL